MRTCLVVPCYNEETRLPVADFEAFLSSTKDVGFLFVNDGSRDKTLEVLRAIERKWPGRVEVLDQQPNQGKAEAVRNGMLQALSGKAEYVGFWDADLATPLDAIAEFEEVLKTRPDLEIVIGARIALLGRAIERKPLRHYLGRVFATAASVALGLPVYDTQCGAKLFRSSSAMRTLFEEPYRSRWIFDVELLARYLTSFGSPRGLYELPLRKWEDVGESKVKPIDFLRAIGEMALIYRGYRLTRKNNKLVALLASPSARYTAAGAIGTLFHYLTLTLLVEFVAIRAPVASAAGATVGAIVNYLLNYHVTFASTQPHSQTAPKFFAIAGLSVALNASGMWLLNRQMGLHYLVAQALCTILVLILGYVLNRAWTFRASRSRLSMLPPPKKGR